MSLAASPRASVTAAPERKGCSPNTQLLLHQGENGSCFRLKYILVVWNSSTRCLLPNYSSAPTTDRVGQRLPLTVCCLPRSQQQDAAFTLQVRFPLPSGLCYVFREKISFTGCLPWRKETVCYFCSLQGWWYSMLALLTICYCFVAYKKNVYWLPLAAHNTRKTDSYYFSHEYAALESSLGLKLVLPEAAQWHGQREWRETGLPITCNSAFHGRDEHKFFLLSSPAIKPKGLQHVKDDSKCCYSFFFMPGSYFFLKIHFIGMLQLSTPGRRKGRNADLLPAKVLHTWHSCITDLLRNWYDLPMDVRQLWFSPAFFGSKCMKIRELRCSLPRRHFHNTHVTTAHTGPWVAFLGWGGTLGQRGKQTWWNEAQCYRAGVGTEGTWHVSCAQMTSGKEAARSLQTRVWQQTDRQVGGDGWGTLSWHTGPKPPLGSDPWSQIHTSILLTIKTKVF